MKKKRKHIVTVRFTIKGGDATPAPPVGTSLGQYGINIMRFLNEFNEQTKHRYSEPVPVVLTINTRTKDFKFITKKPPTAYLIKRAVGIAKGSSDPQRTIVALITRKQLKEIAEYKMDQFNTDNIESAMNIVAGTAKSMGILVAQK